MDPKPSVYTLVPLLSQSSAIYMNMYTKDIYLKLP